MPFADQSGVLALIRLLLDGDGQEQELRNKSIKYAYSNLNENKTSVSSNEI